MCFLEPTFQNTINMFEKKNSKIIYNVLLHLFFFFSSSDSTSVTSIIAMLGIMDTVKKKQMMRYFNHFVQL